MKNRLSFEGRFAFYAVTSASVCLLFCQPVKVFRCEDILCIAELTADFDILSVTDHGFQIFAVNADDGFLCPLPAAEAAVADLLTADDVIFDAFENLGKNPIVITSPIVRMYFKKLTEDYYPDVIVVSYNEIDSNVELQSVGMVTA